MKSYKNFPFISFFQYLYVTLIVLGLMFQAISSAQAGDNHFLTESTNKVSSMITLQQLASSSPDQQLNLIISVLAVGLILMTIYALRWLNRKTND